MELTIFILSMCLFSFEFFELIFTMKMRFSEEYVAWTNRHNVLVIAIDLLIIIVSLILFVGHLILIITKTSSLLFSIITIVMFGFMEIVDFTHILCFLRYKKKMEQKNDDIIEVI